MNLEKLKSDMGRIVADVKNKTDKAKEDLRIARKERTLEKSQVAIESAKEARSAALEAIKNVMKICVGLR